MPYATTTHQHAGEASSLLRLVRMGAPIGPRVLSSVPFIISFRGDIYLSLRGEDGGSRHCSSDRHKQPKQRVDHANTPRGGAAHLERREDLRDGPQWTRRPVTLVVFVGPLRTRHVISSLDPTTTCGKYSLLVEPWPAGDKKREMAHPFLSLSTGCPSANAASPIGQACKNSTRVSRAELALVARAERVDLAVVREPPRVDYAASSLEREAIFMYALGSS